MPKVTPELLREMAKLALCLQGECSRATDKRFYNGRSHALLEIADLLEAEAQESAHLVIPHDPSYHCWGK